MSLYDRQYMRFEPEPARSNPLYWFMGLMLVGYFAQVLSALVLKSGAVTTFLSLSGEGLLHGRAWGLVSYVFAHDPGNPLHLILNLLIVFMAGRVVQDDVGRRRFVWICLFSALGGALFYIVFHLGGLHAPLLGASAVAMGLMTAYCLARPEEPVTFLLFLVLPVTIKPKYLVIGLAAVEVIFLTAEWQGLSSVASSAHLGGMAAAYLYYRKAVFGRRFFPASRKSRAAVRRPVAQPRFTVNLTSRTALRSEVDRILDKINSQGFGSLSDEEKRLLDQARDILGKQS